MKFQVGQIVELELKDGRKIKGEVGSLDQHGMTVWNAEVLNPDSTVSNARIIAIAFQDIVEKEEESEVKVMEEAKPEVEKEVKPEKPSRRRKAARKR
jgi:small nuclear ribonucleoprotein (snRNP)-like protein